MSEKAVLVYPCTQLIEMGVGFNRWRQRKRGVIAAVHCTPIELEILRNFQRFLIFFQNRATEKCLQWPKSQSSSVDVDCGVI